MASRSNGLSSGRKTDADTHTTVADIARLVGATKIETLSVSSLRPNPRNARRHSERQIAQLMASVSRFAVLVPIPIDEDRTVLAGHGRLLAATRLGLTEVPTVRVAHLTDLEKRAYALADNRLAELS